MNLSMQNLFLVVLLLPLFLWGEREYTDEQIAFWEDEAYPVLEENCWSCHGVSKKIRGGLILTTLEGVLRGGEFGPAVDLENPKNSLLLKMTSHQDKDHEMPPDGKMADEDIAVLAKWIELGVPFPKQMRWNPKEKLSTTVRIMKKENSIGDSRKQASLPCPMNGSVLTLSTVL
jgi:mono/diheme cytochrome c family protein